MSIFPKRVAKCEDVIIHFKTVNAGKMKMLNYALTIIDSSGAVIDKFEGSQLAIGTREQYFSHYTSEQEIAGKNHARTKMYLDGRVIESFSSIADYYYVDDIEVREVEFIGELIYFALKNKSGEETPYQIIDTEGNVLTDELLPGNAKRKFQMNGQGLFLKYGNDFIKAIDAKEQRYIKSNDIRWRIADGKVELFDEKRFEIVDVDDNAALIWLKCNGINQKESLARIVGLTEKIVTQYLEKLETMGLIRKV